MQNPGRPICAHRAPGFMSQIGYKDREPGRIPALPGEVAERAAADWGMPRRPPASNETSFPSP